MSKQKRIRPVKTESETREFALKRTDRFDDNVLIDPDFDQAYRDINLDFFK